MARSTDPGHRPEPEELVVELPYAHLLLRRLEAWGARPQEQDRHDRLGLALVHLAAPGAVEHLSREYRGWVADARRDREAGGKAASDIDVVVRCLRRWFREEYQGWVPTFGKNREMSRVGGSYVIDGGGLTMGGDYVIDGGGLSMGGDYVIDGGGYVIDGGGPAGAVPIPGYALAGGAPGFPVEDVDPSRVVPLRGADAEGLQHTGRGARVGVVDTRLRPHPWLAGAYLARAVEAVPDQQGPNQPWAANHAMFVAGLVLRQAPEAVVVGVGTLDDGAQQDSWRVATAIADLAEQRVDVVNLSLGCVTDDARPPLVLTAALAALGPESVVVAAAGNHGNREETTAPRPSWPAAMDSVIAVGASHDGQVAPFSPRAPWVDAYAPGVGLVSTAPGSTLFARWSGTSFAAGVVSGAIAARVGPGRDARQAWHELQQEGARVDDRPAVPLRAVQNWPPDGPVQDGS